MKTEGNNKTCTNCHAPNIETFCPNCGQPAQLKRIDSHYVAHEIQHLFHIEKGVFFTAKELLLRPGVRIREYLSENRNRLIKPVPFLVLTSLITTFVFYLTHFGEGMATKPHAAEPTTLDSINHWVITHYGYANLIMGGLTAFWLRLFFFRHKYNLFEISVLLCFVMGEGMLLFALMASLCTFIKGQAFFLGFMLLIWLYISWAIGQFYGEKKWLNYLKSFLAYTLGFVTFQYGCVLVALVYDYFHK